MLPWFWVYDNEDDRTGHEQICVKTEQILDVWNYLIEQLSDLNQAD